MTGGNILPREEGIPTPLLDRTTRIVLATTAVAGLAFALLSAATGSPLLASIAAVASATAAMIAIVVARRSSTSRTAAAPPTVAAQRRVGEEAPALAITEPTGGPRPVIPAVEPFAASHVAGSAPRNQLTSHEMPESTEPDAVVQGLLDSFGHIETPVAAHLWLYDSATDTMRLIAAGGRLPPASLPVRLVDTILGRALADGSCVFAPLTRARSKSAETSMWRLAIPLAAGDAKGVAAVDFSADPAPALDALLGMASLVRGSLTASLSVYVATQEMSVASRLLGAAGELARNLDPRAVVHATLAYAISLADAATGSVMLIDPASGELAIETSEGLPDDVAASTRLANGEGIAGWVFATGKPLVVEDLPDGPIRLRRRGVRSAFSVPIADDDGILGVLNVGSTTFAARLSDRTLSALETLGRLGAIALRNARAVRATSDLYLDTLKTLALALETKDPYAHGGTERVVAYAVKLGAAMGLDTDEARALEIAALLHDIGMIATGDSTGIRERPLTTVEWGLLKMHPVVAAELLEQAPTLREVAPIVYHHHEHYDGSGYVSGVAGEAIPLAARVLAVADAYVAMTSQRPYRPAMSREEALLELTREAGAQFDPHVVEALCDLVAAESTDDPARCV